MGDSHYTLCQHCYDYSYTACERCGRLIHNDDAYYEDNDDDYPYCYECYERLGESSIKNYNFKPEPIFYGSGNLFYGVELEIDKGGEDFSNAQELLDVANLNCERIYCKHDGSINEGFEIVSHPMTLDYHINNINWSSILEKAVYMDYRSHNTSTCGLHIHCSRSAFGKTFEEQELIISRIVFFVEKHWNELVKFSRRTSENLNRWAAKYATISETAEETYKKAKEKNTGRYVAVNLENYNTVEFRMFRGTLCYRTFIATLQLVDEICYDRSLLNTQFRRFMKKNKDILNLEHKFTIHGLRHTNAALLLFAGEDIENISAHLGHASSDITSRVYAHMYAEVKIRMAKTVSNALFK